MKVSAAGGAPSLLIKARRSQGESGLASPFFLPDGRHFFYSGQVGSGSQTYVGSLDAAEEKQPPNPLVASSKVVYAPPSGPGPTRILFLRPDQTLMAQGFDPSRAELEGDPAVVAQGVTDFTASSNGVLAYSQGHVIPMQLTWFNRQGKVLGTVGEPGIIPLPALSPDGATVAVPRLNETGGIDLWLYNLARGTRSRFTFDKKENYCPVWSPDGSRIVFASTQDGSAAIYQKTVNGMGGEERLEISPPDFFCPRDWSRDGRNIVEEVFGSTTSIWQLPLSPGQAGSTRKSIPYLNDGANETNARLSPNSEWIAYDSHETGRDEVFVQTFPRPGGKWQVSTSGGTRPVWSRDGNELYFIDQDWAMNAVAVKRGPAGVFQSSSPQVLFNPHAAGYRTDTFVVAKDGRFLIPTLVQQVGIPFTVVVNWQASLNK
jgi:WD40 repeat protein